MQKLERIIRAFSMLREGTDQEAGGDDDGEGCRWGHLQVRSRLGSGSFGDVYRAYDGVLERDVALKLRRDGPLAPRGYILEARRLARVRHPHVLAVHGAAVHEGRAGLWCDLIDGQPLNALVAAQGPLGRSEVLATGVAIASAVAAVHAAGLIHGDVKPGNIMRAEDGRVILMDFGTAVEDSGGGVRAVFGSPLAMAPEQIDGGRIGSAVDVYALGVVLYFLACGRYPLEADSLAGLHGLHASGTDPDWSPLRATGGRPLARLVRGLMARDPAARPTAQAAQAALQAIIDAPRRRQRRWLLSGSFAALVLALALSLLALQRIAHERSVSAQAYQRELAARGFMRELLQAPRPGSGGADVRVLDVLADAPAAAERRFANDPLALATALGDIGRSRYALGGSEEARPLLQRAAALGGAHGMQADELLDIQVTLAAAEHYLAPSQASHDAIAALHAQSRATFGDGHAVTVQAALELATALEAAPGRNAGESIASLLRGILAQAQDGSQASTGQQVTAHNKLATLLANGERWDEAEAEIVRALQLADQAHGNQSAASLLLRATAATVAARRGHHAAAEAQLTALLGDTEQRYGRRHRNVRSILNNLAISQRMQGKADAAVATLTRTLDLARGQLGDEHPDVLTIRDNLASALSDTGQRDASRQIREENYAIKLRVLGPRSPGTLLSALNLAEQYVEDGQAERGTALATSAGEDALAVFGEHHLFVYEAREIAARGLLGQGQAGTARDRLLRIHADKQALLGAEHEYSLRSAGFLAAARAASGERRQAIALLRSTLDAMRSRYDADQPDRRRLEALLASLQQRSD